MTAIPQPPRDLFCVLLAGGKGSRLHELTQTTCKPALPFAGARLVDFTLANAVRSGLTQMLVATQYNPTELTHHVLTVWGRAFADGLAVFNGQLVKPGGYQGTADAVRAHLRDARDSGAREVLVLSADHVYGMDYARMVEGHRASGAKVTVAVDEVPLAQATRFGVIGADRRGIASAFAEKPAHPQPMLERPSHALVSMGIYVIDADWLAEALGGRGAEDFGRDLLPDAVRRGIVHVHRAAQDEADRTFYWRDVGTLDSYRAEQIAFLDARTRPVELPPNAVEPSAEAISAGATGTVLMPGAYLGRGARVERAILAPGVVVPDGMVIGEDPDHDRKWFRVSQGGTVLVTRAMMARYRAEATRLRPLIGTAFPAFRSRGL
jgi:glucose-1-phosphate adenylyltransferase